MRTLRAALLGGCTLFAIAGCGAYNMPAPGHVIPGFIVNAMTTPGDLQAVNAVYQAYPDSFVVLGSVEGTASNTNILALFSMGKGGYIAAMDDAIGRSGADGLINCVADVKQSSFLGIFSSSKTIVRGLAIKRK